MGESSNPDGGDSRPGSNMEKEDQVGAPDDQTSTRESDSADMPPQAKSEAGERSGNPAETSGAHNTNGAATKGDSSQRMKRARAVYGQQAELLLAKHSDKNGCIKVSNVPDIAKQLGIRLGDTWEDDAGRIAASEGLLSHNEFFTLVGSFMPAPQQSLPNVTSTRSVASGRRSYLDTGVLTADEAVLEFMRSLQQQQQQAENEGRYRDAKECANKLRELKTKEVERLQAEIQDRHTEEWEEAEKAFVQDQLVAEANWDEKMMRFTEALESQFTELNNRHAEQLELLRATAKRPERARWSKQLLQQREIEKRLAKSGEYDKAIRAKRVADEMEKREMEATMEAFEQELAMKEAKVVQRQKQELEALEQRGKRGKQELLTARKLDREKRERRYRNIRAELTNMQRLEVVQLETFLEQQAIAGKRDLPGTTLRNSLKDGSTSKMSVRASTTSLRASKTGPLK